MSSSAPGGSSRASTTSLEAEGAPPIPAEAREELLALKWADQFVCARPDGDINARLTSGEGFFAHDTRYLSQLSVRVDGRRPVALASTLQSGHHAVVHATNPPLREEDAAGIPQETLNLRRTLLIDDALHCELLFRSYLPRPVVLDVEVILAADFADVFEVRQVVADQSHGELEVGAGEDRVTFAHTSESGARRVCEIVASPTPAHCEEDGQRARMHWSLSLQTQGSAQIALHVAPDRVPTAGRDLGAGASRLAREYAAWRHGCLRVRTDNETFDRLIDASLRDLHALLMPGPEGRLPAAGIPWYVAPFGRDALIVCCETLLATPAVTRDTLLALAGWQAREDDPWRDAEPGKILHELRRGELARSDKIPHPYYGSVDATPLFLIVAGRYYRWTHDLALMQRLRPALDAALEWVEQWGDHDGDGFLDYHRRSPAGLDNQGWKDSGDAIVGADGSLADGPIALVEVQAYAYEAKLSMAEVYTALGDESTAERLRAQASVLRRRFHDAFWDEEEGFFALALDGHGEQVRSVTSNVAHCLYCGIVDDSKAPAVAQRLMAPDMFSGWGVRTLSARSPAYNPMSYHNGSVWPHDSAIAAAGLKRYGFHREATRIADGLFEVARQAPDLRLPELFCGFSREESATVVPYPVACIPQAWAAGAPFMLLGALLGISAHGAERRVAIDRPALPGWLGHVELEGVRVGAAEVDLCFDRTIADNVGFSLLAQRGDARVTMSA